MLVKQLSQSGNSKVALLLAAGLTIQSLESSDPDIKKAAFRKVMKKNHDLLKRLSDR